MSPNGKLTCVCSCVCVCVCVCVRTRACVCAQSLSRVQLFATLWTLACQSPLSMEFSRQEYWSGLPFPPPGDLPDPGTEPMSLVSPALAGGFFTTVSPGKPVCVCVCMCILLGTDTVEQIKTHSSGLVQRYRVNIKTIN